MKTNKTVVFWGTAIPVKIKDVETVTYYPYRTGRVQNSFVCFSMPSCSDKEEYRDYDEDYRDLMDNLCARAGNSARPDNHICFEVKFNDGHHMGIRMSDGNIIIGTNVAK